MKETMVTNTIEKYKNQSISSADDNFWVPSVFRKEFVSISRPQPYPIVNPELCSITKVATGNMYKKRAGDSHSKT